MFAAGIAWEFYTKKRPIIPPRIFKTRTTFVIMISVFLHAFAFFAGTYYLPLYFQSMGASALFSGIEMIPYSFGGSLFAIASGQIVARTGAYRPTMWGAWAIMTLGYGLMLTLDNTSNRAKQVLYLFIPAIGVGSLFITPLIAIQAAMPVKDMATATATLGLMRQIGGTVGISAGGAIYVNFLRKRLNKISGYDASSIPNSDLINNVGSLKNIQPPELQFQVIQAYTKSISSVWLICTPLVAVGLVSVLFMRGYTLKRQAARGAPQAKGAPQPEAGSPSPASPTAETEGVAEKERIPHEDDASASPTAAEEKEKGTTEEGK